MELLKQICAKAKGSGRTIVLPEGQDPRVIKAANLALQENVANIIVLGTSTSSRRPSTRSARPKA